MNPFDLIPWAVAIGISMLILTVPVYIITTVIHLGRQ